MMGYVKDIKNSDKSFDWTDVARDRNASRTLVEQVMKSGFYKMLVVS
jgi:hypothetical protein